MPHNCMACPMSLPPVYQMGLIVVGLLILSSVIVRAIKLCNPQFDTTELTQRIRSWWVMAGLFLFTLFIHPSASLLLFMALSFLALKEYFTLIHTRIEDHRVLFWSFLAIPVQYYWVWIHWDALFFIFIPVYMFLFIPFRLMLTGKPSGMVASMAKIQWGLMAFVFCISHVAYLSILPKIPAVPGGGKAMVLYLVFLTELNDIAQYVWGKLFGKHPIAPNISPKKTVEGFVGGVVTTVVVAVLLQFLSGFTLQTAIITGLIISCAGFIGDLVLSAVKRDVGVKDASKLIPGHGGILDRIDSLTYTGPLFFHYVNYFLFHGLR